MTDNTSSGVGEAEFSDREQLLISRLEAAAERLEKSPTIREYRGLDLEPSAKTIQEAFGSWNAAKTAAGLETNRKKSKYSMKTEFFVDIDSTEAAYWLGTLFAHSSLQENGPSYTLQLGRTKTKEHFVRGFAAAVDSQYPIHEYENEDRPNEQMQVQLQISNREFIEALVETGYPLPGEDAGGFPEFSDGGLRAAFVRGYLESRGGFSTQGWNFTTESVERAEFLKQCFEEMGAKRPSVSSSGAGAATVRVSNVFDIRAVFESCWPELVDTEPSWRSYAEDVVSYLQAEHPHPQNVPYLDE